MLLLLLLLPDELRFFDIYFLEKKTVVERETFLKKNVRKELQKKLVELTNLFTRYPFHHPFLLEYAELQQKNLFELLNKITLNEFNSKILNYQKQFYLQTNKELLENPEIKLESKNGIDYSKLASNPSFNFLNTKSEFDLEMKMIDLHYAQNRDTMSDEEKHEFMRERLLKIINKDK